MRFQFSIDGRATGPLRRTWREAANDAVAAGYAAWVGSDDIKLDSDQGASIRRLSERLYP